MFVQEEIPSETSAASENQQTGEKKIHNNNLKRNYLLLSFNGSLLSHRKTTFGYISLSNILQLQAVAS